MSRAFVREPDGDDAPDALPERAISPHPNLVTARGLRLIEERVHALELAREEARARDDKTSLARLDRDLRYWRRRHATAQPIETAPAPSEVGFGTRVTLREASGAQRMFSLVGEDEADPAVGRISWVSPVAQALLGREVGDAVSLLGRSAEIVAIDTAE